MSEQKTSTDGLMKIGELAKAANVNVSTLKFYVKEELIRPAL
ncbi:MAG: MerR family DNA-binding transcriptional regulator, partial [Eubacteriales bacterium]|nr:MerR family DNA-binding transcriptional regulator [Eubacteriales bacterium]